MAAPTEQPVDGTSFLSLLRGATDLERAPIFWHFPLYLRGLEESIVKPVFGTQHPYWRGVPSTAMRKGKWKLIYYYEDRSIDLFDLATDPGETRDVASEYPDQARRMSEELLAWVEDTRAPVPSTLNPAFDPGAALAVGDPP